MVSTFFRFCLTLAAAALCIALTHMGPPPPVNLGDEWVESSRTILANDTPGWHGEILRVVLSNRKDAHAEVDSDWRASNANPDTEYFRNLSVKYFLWEGHPATVYRPSKWGYRNERHVTANGHKTVQMGLMWPAGEKISKQIECETDTWTAGGLTSDVTHEFRLIDKTAPSKWLGDSYRVKVYTGKDAMNSGKPLYYRPDAKGEWKQVAFVRDTTNCDSVKFPFQLLKVLPLKPL